ncbi:MAG: molybdenum cofactor guanylyltransferase [bacterium]|nr:molybdenum cofactor guanylyltransferase [bacterium]MDE0602663.1 molybdenum cofactor guanylyltransferase [bacterium]
MILAGGRSRRMGRDKAMTLLDGRTLLDWVSAALSLVVSEVIVVGREEAGSLRAIPDALPGGRGPSAGIVTGLRAAGGGPIVVLGVDQPWVRPATLAALLGVRPQPAIPMDGQYQVTCATYPAKSLCLLTAIARDQRSLQPQAPLLEGTVVLPERWRSWGEDGRSWFSVDSPDDLQEGLRRYGVPETS